MVRLQRGLYEKNDWDFSTHLVLVGSNGICLQSRAPLVEPEAVGFLSKGFQELIK